MEEKGEIGIASIHAALATGRPPRRPPPAPTAKTCRQDRACRRALAPGLWPDLRESIPHAKQAECWDRNMEIE